MDVVERVARKMAELDSLDPDAHPSSEYRGPVIHEIAWSDDAKIWHMYAWKAKHIIVAVNDERPGLFLVGQFRAKTDAGTAWDFQGVFSTREAAIAACVLPTFGVMAVTLDETLPVEMSEQETEYPLS